MIPVFHGRIENAKLRVYQKPLFADYLKTLEDREIEITVQKRRDQRTINQNRFLWGVVYKLISEHTGHTPEKIHDFCKDKFLDTKIIKVGDEEREVKKCTHDVPKDRFFEDYIDPVRMWAAEYLEIVIPDPDTVEP